jgi:hypothetical protein
VLRVYGDPEHAADICGQWRDAGSTVTVRINGAADKDGNPVIVAYDRSLLFPNDHGLIEAFSEPPTTTQGATTMDTQVLYAIRETLLDGTVPPSRRMDAAIAQLDAAIAKENALDSIVALFMGEAPTSDVARTFLMQTHRILKDAELV